MPLFLQRAITPLFIFIIVSAIVGAAYVYGTFNTFQEKITDRFFLKQEVPQDIVIIAIDNESIQKIGSWPFRREVIGEAIEKLENAQKIGIDVSFTEPSRFGELDDQSLASALQKNKDKVFLPVQIESGSNLPLYPLSLFKNQSKGGITNTNLDSDGIARTHLPLQQNIPSFALALSGEQTETPFRIHFRGGEKTFLTIPLIDLLESRIPGRVTEGKIVLIGATAADLHDTALTPFGTMPGVELHANILYTITHDAFFKETSKVYGLLSLLFVNLLALFLVFRIKRFAALVLTLVSLFLALFVGSMLLFGFSIVVPVLYLMLGFVLSSVGSITLGYITESKEKRFIRKGFQYYLSEEVVDQIIKNPEKLKLGGETKKVTVLFSDIRGFTTISEALSPQDLMGKLNIYLTAMTDIIMEKRGLVDKYIGDAVMAFWGAPLENVKQAEDACTSVISQIKKLEELNSEWKNQNVPPFNIGVGLNTGYVVVGNMGSEKRFNYTIIGDEVNFASRLEGLNKPYGTSCIISESTKKEIEGNPQFKIRELDLVMVKGKKEPKRIFELITKEMTPTLEKIVALFGEGRKKYTEGKFKEAIPLFKEALALQEDGPSKLFLERCQELLKNPPSEWSGVYEFKTK